MSDHKGGGAEFCGALYGCSGHEAASRPQPGRGAGGGWPQGALQPWAQQDGWVNARWSGHVWKRTTELLYFVPSLSLTDMYVKDIQSGICAKDGEPVVEKESAATALVDGKNLLGPVVGNFCMDLAIKKAKEVGVGWVVAHGVFRLPVKSPNRRRKTHDRNRHRLPIVPFRFQPLWNRWTLCNVGSEAKHDCKSCNILLFQL